MNPAPRAVHHFGFAAMASRARHTAKALTPPVPVTPLAPRRPVRPVRRRTVVRLWLPTTFLFLLLAPFAFLLAPCIYWVTPRRMRIAPFATVLALGRVLLSLGGTVIDVDSPEAFVSLRIF